MRTSLTAGAARAAVIALLALLAVARPTGADDGTPRSPEYLIKAAYLYNFAMFVDWPSEAFATPDSSIVIGIIGADPFGWALDRTVEDKRINGRRIVVQRLQWSQDPSHCHIVFVSDPARLSEVADRLAGAATLVVADTDTAARRSAINFIVRDNKVGFEINLNQARSARLTISSKLLNLARVVR